MLRKNGWSSGSRHTKPIPSQNWCSLNRPCRAKWLVRRWPLPSLLSDSYSLSIYNYTYLNLFISERDFMIAIFKKLKRCLRKTLYCRILLAEKFNITDKVICTLYSSIILMIEQLILRSSDSCYFKYFSLTLNYCPWLRLPQWTRPKRTWPEISASS